MLGGKQIEDGDTCYFMALERVPKYYERERNPLAKRPNSNGIHGARLREMVRERESARIALS